MSYQKDRDEFIAFMSREGLSLTQTRALLRHAATLNRLAVAQCNGDWPAGNGERPTVPCPECANAWVKSSFRKGVCPDCVAQQAVKKVLLPSQGFVVDFSGDPRGCVLKLRIPARWGERSFGVPVRER